MKYLIAEIAKQLVTVTKLLTAVNGCQFVSFTYKAKTSGEVARHTLNLGFNYHTAVLKSVTELEILMAENHNTWTDLQKFAAHCVMFSLKKTLDAHSRGEQNPDYTKRGQYIHVRNGVNINSNDNTLQVFGLAHRKVTLVDGEYPTVNSSPLTLAKNNIRKQLTVGRFREFALDPENIQEVKVNGETVELETLSV